MNRKKNTSALLNSLGSFLCSLKLAVMVILGLALSLAAATFIESLYDTPTAQYWIYRTYWFYGLMALLATNIFCVAMSRFPWKPKHIPFLLAHLGILILLAGSWITARVGIDGSLRISEGETSSVVDLDSSTFFINEKTHFRTFNIPWMPPGVAFKPIRISDKSGVNSSPAGIPIIIDQYISHADSQISFVSAPEAAEKPEAKPAEKQEAKPTASRETDSPAIRFTLKGGPMAISQEFWLWNGAPNWKSIQAGPAQFSISTESENHAGSAGQSAGPSAAGLSAAAGRPAGPSLAFQLRKNGHLAYRSKSSSGKVIQGEFAPGKMNGQVIQPQKLGWKGNLTVTIEEFIPNAVAMTSYKPARIQYGLEAPGSAIHVTTQVSEGIESPTDVWLGLGDRAVLQLGQREIEIGYFPKRIILPFSVRLEKFSIQHDPGTFNPAAYSSDVSVIGGKMDAAGTFPASSVHTISMNEPLEYQGFTLYQASYENAMPRPITSIFTVNRDPGRPWKYLGSLLIVLGSVLLFAMKYRGRRAQKSTSPNLGVGLGSELGNPSLANSAVNVALGNSALANSALGSFKRTLNT